MKPFKLTFPDLLDPKLKELYNVLRAERSAVGITDWWAHTKECTCSDCFRELVRSARAQASAQSSESELPTPR